MFKNHILLLLCLLASHISHAQSVNEYKNIIDTLLKKEQFEAILPLGERMRAIALDSFGVNSMEYYRAVTRLAMAYEGLNDWTKARPFRLESKDVIEKVKGKKFIGYATQCSGLGLLDQRQSHFESAKVFMLEALESFRLLFGAEDLRFAKTMIQLGIIDFNLGNYESAQDFNEKSRALLVKNKQTETREFADLLLNIGVNQLAQNEMNSSVQTFREALTLRRRLQDYDTTGAKFWLATDLIRTAQFDEAEQLLLQIGKEEIKRDLGRYKIQALQELARIKGFTGRFSEGESLLRKSLELEAATAGKETFQYALGLNQLSAHLRAQYKLEEALRYALEALDLKEKIFGKTDLSYVISLIEVADCYTRQRQWEKAEAIFLEAQNLLPQISVYTNDRLTDIQNSLGDLYFDAGRHSDSRQAYKAALATLDANNGASFSSQRARVNKMLGILATMEKDTNEARSSFSRFENGRNEWFTRALPSLNDAEKLQFLAEFKDELGELYEFQFHQKNVELPALLLSRQLLYKNLATSSLENLVREMETTTDTLAKADFNDWRDIRSRLANLYTLPKTELDKRVESIPELEDKAANLEKSLSRRSAKFARHTASKPPSHWQDLRDILQPGEAAIDIARVAFQGFNSVDTTLYAFIVVTPETRQQPALLFLPNGDELESILIEQYRSDAQSKKSDAKISETLYNAFWKPIEPLLGNAKRVFVAPDGVYNKINLQTLRRPDGKYLLDAFDFVLVSNLKDLLIKAPDTQIPESRTAFLLGNPAFSDAPSSGDTSAVPAAMRSVYEAVAEDRGIKLSPLPGTEKEVKNIAALLQKKGWTVTTSLGKNATEESVKKAQSPVLMHLATHGYFLEDEHKSKQNLGFQTQYVGQNPLLRSMVFFAGAQHALDLAPASGREDGILTAYEAQNLNLENTELLVLSACDTGLGKIENGEGVLGLQRAFRIAGAKTTIMSLWAIDDAITQLLMSSFYENWLSGKSKAQAFRAAQQRVKDKYPQPYYWGAFVMLGT